VAGSGALSAVAAITANEALTHFDEVDTCAANSTTEPQDDGAPANAMLAAALGCAKLGHRVFPCWPGQKEPMTTHGCKDATTDQAQIEEWWKACPDANIGLAPGDDLAVIDIDVKDGKDGEATLRQHVAQYGPLPATAMQTTPTGGRHLFFRTPRPVRNTADRPSSPSPIGRGIDSRGPGGYVLVAPSLHPNGGNYEWADGCALSDLPPAPLPDWMLDRIERRDREPDKPDSTSEPPAPRGLNLSPHHDYAEAALEREIARLRLALPGGQNGQLNGSAYGLGQLVAAGVLDRDRVEKELFDAASQWVFDPSRGAWYPHQLNAIIKSGLEAGMKKPRQLPATPAEPTTVPAATFEPAVVEWPEPGLLDAPLPAPPFPTDALPQVLDDFCLDVAERMQCPIGLVAIPAFITLAGLIGKDATIRPKAEDDWSERACLWGVIIYPKGGGKTPALREATAPLRRIEAALLEQHKAEHAKWRAKKEEADRRLKAYEAECQKILKDQGLHATLPTPPEPAPEEPQTPRILVSDATVQKVADLMVGSRGLTLIRDELAGFYKSMNQFNKGGADRQFYTECNTGGDFAVDRIARGSTLVKDVYLNILGGIQPSVAQEIFGKDPVDDGFFERFSLIEFPDLPKVYRYVDRRPDAEKLRRYDEVCDRLAKQDWHEVLHSDEAVIRGSRKPYARFTPEAQPSFKDWVQEHKNRALRLGDDPIAGFMAKAPGLLVRLVLVIHLTAYFAGEESSPRDVSVKSLGRALMLLDEYLMPMWRRTLGAFGHSAEMAGARRIAKLILEKRLDRLRPADITKNGMTGLTDHDAVVKAMRVLVGRDWLREPPTREGPGRQSATYAVNPRVHEKFGGGKHV
jgi:putative DNA primase/helicase